MKKTGYKILPQAKTALDLLSGAGYEVRLVGGCVRDLARGAEPTDWDIASNAEPEETERVFKDFRVIETGIKHGTVTVLIDSVPLEITTYRVDGKYADSRRPSEVRFTKSLEDDLKRRDFTVNALAYSPETGITDIFGGLDDLKNGVIRCVGEPHRRFGEDSLRILRALRFASTLGFDIERGTEKAMYEAKDAVRGISAERVQSELTKLICGKNAAAVLRKYVDIVGAAIPEILPMVGFEQHNPYHCFDVWEHTLAVLENIPPRKELRWAALLHDIAKPAVYAPDGDRIGHFYGHEKKSAEMSGIILRRLKFDKAGVDRILALVSAHGTPITADKKTVRRRLNKYGESLFFDLIMLFRADNMGQAETLRYRQEELDRVEALAREIISESECFSLKKLALNGNDLSSLGLSGREIGRALDMLLAAVMDEKVANEKSELIKYLERAGE